MPLTKRKFEIGIDEQLDGWMKQIYRLLVENKELAYSFLELSDELLGVVPLDISWRLNQDRKRLQYALDALVKSRAAERRAINDADYYVFDNVCDTDTWELRSGL